MNHLRVKINSWLFQLIYLPVYLISLLPYKLSRITIGQFLYFISYRVFKYRYSVILQNLSRSLPAKSYQEIQQITKDFYIHLANMVIETLKLYSISSQSMDKKVTVNHTSLLIRYQQQNRNIIAVLGHYGNWECLNILPAQLPFKVNAIYKPLFSPVMDKLIRRIRSRFGMQLIPANQALRHLLKYKDQPQLSIFIADQFPGVSVQNKFDFLHQPTQMFNGAEKLAHATNAVVVYLEMKRKPDQCWEIDFSLITDSPRKTADQEITKRFALKLHQTINNDPAYWLWSHRRWKN